MDRAYNAGALSGNFRQKLLAAFESVGLVAIYQRKGCAAVHTLARAFRGSLAEIGGVLGAAARASHHPFMSLLLVGLLLGRGRFRRSCERRGSCSQSCKEQSEDKRYAGSESDDLEPEAIRFHRFDFMEKPSAEQPELRTLWMRKMADKVAATTVAISMPPRRWS